MEVANQLEVVVGGVTYWRNTDGALIPLDRVTELERLENDMVRALAQAAKVESARTLEFRTHAFGEAGAFMQLAAEKHDVKLGGKKGNVTFFSYDGSFKVEIAQADKIAFDHRLQLAQAKFLECVTEWVGSAGSDTKPGLLNLITIVNETFEVEDGGAISPTKIARLRKYEFKDERWTEALNLVSESMRVIGKRSYIRFYERAQDGEYLPIVMNFSAL